MASTTQIPSQSDANDEVFQLITAHQEKAARLPPIEEVKTILNHSIRGMLSTFSQTHEGYPSGSMVDYACDDNGSPILAVSNLAIHTKDLLANPKCSLLIAKDPEDRTDLSITLHGDAVIVPENERDAVRTTYIARHPDAFWVDFDDFLFLRIEPKVVCYVSGVATSLFRSGEFTNNEFRAANVDQIYQFSKPITSHMNKDHSNDTKLIVQHSTLVPVDFAYMLDVDSLGFNVKAGYQDKNFKLRVAFPRRAGERKDVKTLIIEMLQAAKSRKEKNFGLCSHYHRLSQPPLLRRPRPPAVLFRISIMTEPSKVIHVRNVGHEISEPDLLQLFQPFGVINKLVMLRAKNQALLQLQDVPSAVSAMQFYANVQPSIRGRNVYVQFSSHQELTTMEQNTQGRVDEPNRILLVTIHHMLYPITVEVLHQVFSPHGYVEKIVTFQKSAGFQALIQFQLRQSAVAARNSLQGRNIYDGCCQLDIQFSNLEELQVNYNNERSRDFTNPSLPSEQKGRPSQPGYGDAGGMYTSQAFGAATHIYICTNNAAAIAAAFGGGLPPGISGTNDRCTILVSNLNPDRIDEDKLFNLFSLYGNIVRIKLLRNKPDHALVQMGDGFQAELAVHFLKGATLFEKRLEVNFSKHPNITMGAETHEYLNSNLNRFNRNAAKNYRYCCSPTKMIHLSTLPQDVTEDEIISHLEEHGGIMNTKVFEMNGKKQALVLFETEEQATEALVCKHATTLADSIIRISFSQLQTI
ncbi:hypothetical protein SSX86_012682 [Deinandra increscens subsp. villosa]|uniref:RRM domain-containing protein n=1 Tax=Deinandra increscens subsp. villosa TaxID=3103831 RepID=A0AAP0D9T9_9ASTR